MGRAPTAGCGKVKFYNFTVSEHQCDHTDHNICRKIAKVTAGGLAHSVAKWREITSDKWVIDTVQHYHIEFNKTPFQTHIPRESCFSSHENYMITKEIHKMLQKGAIVETNHTDDEFISNIFLRPKKDGSFRLIVNVQGLNVFVAKHHFKMEAIRYAIQLIRPNCSMASIDLKDAYFSVSVAKEHRKFLRFLWQAKVYEFTCLPFGLACAPRVFSKVMKPLVASLSHVIILTTRCFLVKHLKNVLTIFKPEQVLPKTWGL